MVRECYRYAFGKDVCVEDVEGALLLAVLAIEALHGQAQARMDVRHAFDRKARACVVDATTQTGRDFAKLLTGFLRREIDERDFSVKRIEVSSGHAQAAA
jgi:hypothetical protein